ncbi:hypothetical protein EYF80_025263 [Liparis tanakae]|uniref:Uncharacterized protein n=1 Tax=Liparis tanakae TaxID=230148 RepID=A0A4Z2HGY2_9TELE|nr:hypothetical protein EYF80_025263 [Liparis tanakae]
MPMLSCSLMRALVLLRNEQEIFFTRALTAFLPVARTRLVALCLCPCSIGSENVFLKFPKLPRQPEGDAIRMTSRHKGPSSLLFFVWRKSPRSMLAS